MKNQKPKHTPGVKKGNVPWNKGKGKGYVNQRGYRCHKINGREVKEHRLFMERHLGRKLEPWEHVHHKDGDKLNNAINNLEVIDGAEHIRIHHEGMERSDQAKKTMAIFRTMRMEIRRLESANIEMLGAIEYAISKMKTQERAYGCSKGLIIARQELEAIVKKARGEA